MAKAKGTMGVAVLALLTGLSFGSPAAACEVEGWTPAQIRACEVRLAQERAAEEAAEDVRSEQAAEFEQEEMRKMRYEEEEERRAMIEANLASSAARYRTQVRKILEETGSVDDVGDVVAFLDFVEEQFKRSAAPWLYSDVLNPWTYPDDAGGEDTGTGGEGTDTGGEGTDPGTGTGGGGTGTGGGTDTGGGTTDPDPETDLPVPDEGTGGDGTEDGPIRVGLAPFPGEGVVWRCSNFRLLTPQEEVALGAIEGEVSFVANQLVLRGQDGVERTLSVQIVSDGNGEVVLVWPWPNQSALDAVCPL
jgi:hypothetical protein